MKQVIKNYSFNAAAKTVTLTDFSTVLLERLALITDTTANKIIYNFADNTVTTATVSTNVITLSTLPSGVVTGDKLRIDYDVQTGDPVYDMLGLPANNTYGSTTALVDSATATLVNVASSPANFRITGFNGTGNADGYFFLQVAGSTVLSGRTSWGQPSAPVMLPNPQLIPTGSVVALKVTNISGNTANFEGTLLGA